MKQFNLLTRGGALPDSALRDLARGGYVLFSD
jgi:hypothetical protein